MIPTGQPITEENVGLSWPWPGDAPEHDTIRAAWESYANEVVDEAGRIDLTDVDTCVCIGAMTALRLAAHLPQPAAPKPDPFAAEDACLACNDEPETVEMGGEVESVLALARDHANDLTTRPEVSEAIEALLTDHATLTSRIAELEAERAKDREALATISRANPHASAGYVINIARSRLKGEGA
jgi:hypothetical protein